MNIFVLDNEHAYPEYINNSKIFLSLKVQVSIFIRCYILNQLKRGGDEEGP